MLQLIGSLSTMQQNIISNLRGLEMCLKFGVFGVFVICVKHFWVLLKDNRCVLRVLFYMCIALLFSRGIKHPWYFS